MAASLNDQAILAGSTLFKNRVLQSLVASCISITTEAVTVSTLLLHVRRAAFAHTVLNNQTTYQVPVAVAVATDVSVIGDATQAGTVVLTSGNVDAQQALVTDAHINAAISGQFNAFFNVES